MAKRLPHKDVVVVGLGWAGSIIANELTDEGLDVVAIERGPWRDTATDFNIGFAADELRYVQQLELMLRPAQTTVTARNNDTQTALPMRSFGSFHPGNGVGGCGVHLGRNQLALRADGLPHPLASYRALWSSLHS